MRSCESWSLGSIHSFLTLCRVMCSFAVNGSCRLDEMKRRLLSRYNWCMEVIVRFEKEIFLKCSAYESHSLCFPIQVLYIVSSCPGEFVHETCTSHC